jgi:large subunit ribosomal protein L25
MKIEIKAEPRSVQGTGASRRLRRESKVPGILYGAGKDALPIELDHKDLWFKLKMEAFHASILDMDVAGESSQVLLRDYQMHPFRPMILHADFQRVDANKKIHMKVPLHFVNAEISPGVKIAGGLVSHVMNELEISCLPKDLPEFIEVDLSGLKKGTSLHLNELALPKGVKAVTHGKKNPVIVSVVTSAAEESAETAAGTEGAAAAAPAAEAKAAPAKAAGKDAAAKPAAKAPAGKK